MLNYYLYERLGMPTNTTIILNGHFHDLLGLPVPPWNFLEIAVVVFFLGWMSIPFTSRQCQNNENKWKFIKKLSYHRRSAGRRSFIRCSPSFKDITSQHSDIVAMCCKVVSPVCDICCFRSASWRRSSLKSIINC